MPAKDVPSYVTVKQELGACSAKDIAAFIANCVTTTTTCNKWLNASGNQTCVGCLAPDPGISKGGLLFNAAGNIITANRPGCIALADPANGPTCAQAYEPLLQCEAYGCGQCQDTTADYDSCKAKIDDDACHQYVIGQVANCMVDFADGGVYNTVCYGATDAEETTNILNVICGTGS